MPNIGGIKIRKPLGSRYNDIFGKVPHVTISHGLACLVGLDIRMEGEA